MPADESEWKARLTDEQYRVLRAKGTEAPFTGKMLAEKRTGTFNCAACGTALFPSNAKFESGTGWPSFDQAISGAVEFIPDESLDTKRTEVVCANCKSHLGHIFDDGPSESGKRYCINSVCLGFSPEA